jgi:hypothetical protein
MLNFGCRLQPPSSPIGLRKRLAKRFHTLSEPLHQPMVLMAQSGNVLAAWCAFNMA